ncbi:MAG: hypothetical protein IT200_18435 [Thermoleophilia bacterium]|nr:hypothetical protein [Thermoleophilia bacterium]
MTGEPRDPALQDEVERLERIAQELGQDGNTPETLRQLADQALQTADRISQMLPRALDPEAAK